MRNFLLPEGSAFAGNALTVQGLEARSLVEKGVTSVSPWGSSGVLLSY